MPRPQTKEALIDLINSTYQDLMNLIEHTSLDVQESQFQFKNDPLLKEAHYKRDENLRDVLVHLYEWQLLLLGFLEALKGDKNIQVSFLPDGYTWKNYQKMNEKIKEKHQQTTLQMAKNALEETHHKILCEINELPENHIFEKGYFMTIKNTTLLLYITANTSSHYFFAYKKYKKHINKYEG